jgi:cyanophycin synthetase
MKLIEIRDLDGPNIFLLEPAIKLELQLDVDDQLAELRERAPEFINGLHHERVDVSVGPLETPGHVAVVFPWSNRRFAVGVAQRFVQSLSLLDSAPTDAELDALREHPEADDRPLMVTDRERRIPVAAITGTNGKTTTTRVLAHMLMQAGNCVGWSSTSGVYIDGVEVLHGDYSGPSGARRVINDPDVDVGVLETARGGILLRGLACESNDVSVFTNISADHLNLHGIHTVEGLAMVKAVVCHTTRPDGVAALNADDPLVVGSTDSIRAEKLYFTRDAANATVSDAIAAGGRALIADAGAIDLVSSEGRERLCDFTEAPMTFGGRAGHMVENAMAAAGAAIGLGLSLEDIRSGLASFRNSTDQNLGRLNVFDVDGVTVVFDFAHNEAGLIVLLDFARRFVAEGGRLIVLIGTAGDRTDESLREIGRIAAAGADRVIIKWTKKYERGRTNDEMIGLYRQGGALAGRSEIKVSDDELHGLRMALADAKPGDAVALMCQEQMDEMAAELQRIGRPVG